MRIHLILKMLFKEDKKGNFALIFSFIIGLLFLLFLFYGSFFMYQYQVNSQFELLESGEEQNPYSKSYTSFELNSPYEFMGRTNYNLKNTGRVPLLTHTSQNRLCFDIFSQNNFFDSTNAKISTQNSLISNYMEIGVGDSGNLQLYSTSLENKSILLTSCNGINFKSTFNNSNYFWFDDNYNLRSIISSSDGIEDYNVEVNASFDNTQINFTQFREDDMAIALSLNQYSIYELPFETQENSYIETSFETQEVILGTNESSQNSDPTFVDGVLFNAVSLNGSQQLITNDFTGINNSMQSTISFWIKDSTLLGDEQILYNSEFIDLKTSSLNPQDLELRWRFNDSWGSTHTFADVLNENTWQMISISFNNSESCLYLNSEIIGCEADVQTNLSSLTSDLIIGNSPSNNGFSGHLDELSIFSIALKDSEINDLYTGSQLFREISFIIDTISIDNEELEIIVDYPKTLSSRPINSYLYYDK